MRVLPLPTSATCASSYESDGEIYPTVTLWTTARPTRSAPTAATRVPRVIPSPRVWVSVVSRASAPRGYGNPPGDATSCREYDPCEHGQAALCEPNGECVAQEPEDSCPASFNCACKKCWEPQAIAGACSG